MQNIRTLRRRIRSVQNTQKITQAMQLVAGAKLRRSQGELINFRPYAQRLKEIAGRFLEAHPALTHPLLSAAHPEPVERERPAFRPSTSSGRTGPVGLLVVTSDTGLCGTYNERILEVGSRFLQEHPSAVVAIIGKRGCRVVARRGIHPAKEITDWGGRFDPAKARDLLDWMETLFLEGKVGAWWVAYTRFLSALRFTPVVDRFLPIGDAPFGDTLGRGVSLYGASPEKQIVEPNAKTVAGVLLKRFVAAEWKRLLLEAFTSEHSARMMAMKNATDNAAEMIQHLTLVRNKARQASITKELIEVVSGAEALK